MRLKLGLAAGAYIDFACFAFNRQGDQSSLSLGSRIPCSTLGLNLHSNPVRNDSRGFER